MKVLDCAQRSPEWFAARLGCVTGSRACDVLATIKSGEAAARRNYRVQLVLERLTGKAQESGYQSEAMRIGIEREADAVLLYEAMTGRLVTTTGFLSHDTYKAGCSLDGHYGDFEGIVEVKSPTAAIHFEYLKTGKVPADYVAQCVHAMWITGARWADWLSYNPDFPEGLNLKLVRLLRNDVAIRAYEAAVLVFLQEVDRECEALATMGRLGQTLQVAVGA